MGRAARQLELSGVIAAAITARRDDSQDPDFSASLDLLDFLAAAGVRGICLLGSTGEFLDYTFAERQRLVYLGAKRCRVPLLVGVSHSTLAGAVQLADDALSSGADGLLLMPPYFYSYAAPEIEEFCIQFAKETSDALPVLLCNDPGLTSPLALVSVRKLLDSGRFAGLKDASGDWSYFEQLIALKKERPFALLCGHDRLARQALAGGADGLISSAACAVPELLIALAREMAAGKPQGVPEYDAKLAQFLDWIEKFPVPAGIKRAVELRGQKSGAPLVPLAPASKQLMTEFSLWFKTWLPAMRQGSAHA